MSTHQFEDPAAITGDTINYQELNGLLLLITALEALDHVPTSMTAPGEKSPAVRADVVILDGPRAGTKLENTLVFPKVFRAQLSRSIGKMVLGRLGQGQAKASQSPPWVLNPPTEAEKATADQYLARGSVTNAEPPF
jgi:hypothetical protein